MFAPKWITPKFCFLYIIFKQTWTYLQQVAFHQSLEESSFYCTEELSNRDLLQTVSSRILHTQSCRCKQHTDPGIQWIPSLDKCTCVRIPDKTLHPNCMIGCGGSSPGILILQLKCTNYELYNSSTYKHYNYMSAINQFESALVIKIILRGLNEYKVKNTC